MTGADWAILVPAVAGLLTAAAAWIRAEVANRRVQAHEQTHTSAATRTSRQTGVQSDGD